jgi:hypothetical protein
VPDVQVNAGKDELAEGDALGVGAAVAVADGLAAGAGPAVDGRFRGLATNRTPMMVTVITAAAAAAIQ